VLGLVLSALVSADVACAESGHNWSDVDAVLAVMQNRAVRREQPLWRVATAPGQFARGCSQIGKTVTTRHLLAGTRATLWMLDTPGWLDGDVLYFCSERGPTSGCARWREKGSWARRRLEEVGETRWKGRLVHRYFSDRRIRG